MMKYYCTLIARSNEERTAIGIFRSEAAEMLKFEDTRSEANLARAERWRNARSSVQFIVKTDLPRYCWSLTSRNAIDTSEPDLCVHVSWLLSQLKPGASLVLLREAGVECTLAFYWGGQGTGGGPVITPRLSALLCQHEIDLNIGFYFEEA